jgi:hypothetical protein
MKKLYIFSRAAGLKLNKSKTEAIWIGKDKNSDETPTSIQWKTEVYALGILFSSDINSIIDRNFASKFDKFCRVLNMWRARELSIKGKITVVKTLALPILLYASSILTISDNWIDKINREMYKFIWNGKPEKIKRKVLSANIPNGGLKMVDFVSMVKAQKVMWARRLIAKDKASWKAFPLWCLGKIGVSLLKCRLDSKKIPLNLPNFYHEVVKSWAETKECDESVKTCWDVRRQSLFFNRYITIDNEYVWERLVQWFDKGIFLIHDIVNRKGEYLKITELNVLYNIEVDVLAYNSIKDAIPVGWRHLLKEGVVDRNAISVEEEPYLVITDNKQKPLSLLSNKIVYCKLLNHKLVVPKCIEKWSLIYPGLSWPHIFELAFIVTRSTQLQTLQYKILHRIYPCNYWVAKWDPDTIDVCSRCNRNEVDTIQHFFYSCNNVQPLWIAFKNWWEVNMDEHIDIGETDVIFGLFPVNDENVALNLSILLAKKYIEIQNCLNSGFSLYGFMLKVKNFLTLERYICTKNGKVESFETRFMKMYQALG